MKNTAQLLASLALAVTVHAQSDPRMDPQAKAVLDAHASLNPKPLATLSPEEARKQPSPADAVKQLLKQQGKPTDPEPVGDVKNTKEAKGSEGQRDTRIYTPKGDGPFPVLVYYHGGGWVIANLDTYDASCRALTNAAQCIVVSVHYRQAPEHRFPAAADDAYAAYKWVTENAAKFKGDPKRIAVGGESAGGNLATVTCMKAKELGIQMPVFQLLVYPVTNAAMDTPSMTENAQVPPLTKDGMAWFWGHYLSKKEDGKSPYASPLMHKDLSGLPPAMIITAELDVLRDEGEAYGKKLEQAGVKVQAKRYPGMIHEFFGMGAVVDQGKQAVADAGAALKAAFGK